MRWPVVVELNSVVQARVRTGILMTLVPHNVIACGSASHPCSSTRVHRSSIFCGWFRAGLEFTTDEACFSVPTRPRGVGNPPCLIFKLYQLLSLSCTQCANQMGVTDPHKAMINLQTFRKTKCLAYKDVTTKYAISRFAGTCHRLQ